MGDPTPAVFLVKLFVVFTRKAAVVHVPFCQLSDAEKAVTRPLEWTGCKVNFLDFSPANAEHTLFSLLNHWRS